MAWITTDDLRGFVGNTKAGDEVLLQLAVDNACMKVTQLCGPIAYTTVTDEHVEVYGANEICLNFPAAQLISLTEYRTGYPLAVTDWAVSGQRLKRRSGVRIWKDLAVTYKAGYYDDTLTTPAPPPWAVGMALYIGQQMLRTMGKFRSTTDPTPSGFATPKVALDLGADFLLLPRIA